MKFLADVGVSYRVVEWLRLDGHDVLHLPEMNQHQLKDHEIFKNAASESRTVITFDLDFGGILSLTQSKEVSIILFRLLNTRTEFVIRRLDVVIKNCLNELNEGSIVVVEDHRCRIRKLPV